MKTEIPGTFTDLNTYINAERSNKHYAAKIKKQETERVYWHCKEHAIKPITEYPVMVSITWYLPDYRKDPDNVAFAVKFILDGFVMAGVLENDGMKQIRSTRHFFRVDKKNPRVEVWMYEGN